MYDYKEGEKRVRETLISKTKIEELGYVPSSDEKFTYENGIYAWVGALFVDIRKSSEYFKEKDKEHTARIMRAFCSEVVSILSENEQYVEIGIRGDCVYAIYSAPKQDHLLGILEDAVIINTFHEMFKRILKSQGFDTFEIGIGLGASKDLVVKTGKKGTGISDNVWIGNAVIDASNLSKYGNKDTYETIIMNTTFNYNIKDFGKNSELYKKIYINKLNLYAYSGDVIKKEPYNWIIKGMQ